MSAKDHPDDVYGETLLAANGLRALAISAKDLMMVEGTGDRAQSSMEEDARRVRATWTAKTMIEHAGLYQTYSDLLRDKGLLDAKATEFIRRYQEWEEDVADDDMQSLYKVVYELFNDPLGYVKKEIDSNDAHDDDAIDDDDSDTHDPTMTPNQHA